MVRPVADDLAFPNGMAITADGTTLIVAESYGNRLMAFDIGPDGDLGGGESVPMSGTTIPTGSVSTPRVLSGTPTWAIDRGYRSRGC